MRRFTRRSLRLFVVTVVIPWLAGCYALRPQVPGRDAEVISSLTGFLVIECAIDSEARIGAFDLPAGRRVRVVTPDCEENCLEPSLSPDGEKTVFAQGSSEGADIWQVDADGQNSKPLVQGEVAQAFPAWSSDGSLVAYQVLEGPYTLNTQSGHTLQAYRYSSLHIAKHDGTGGEGLTRRDGHVLALDWAPGGEQLVVSACLEDLNQDGVIGDGDRTRLYVVDLTTRGVRPILGDVDPKLSMYKPSWSPDGAHIAYVEGHGDPASYGDLVVANADDGSEVARLDIGPGAAYSWSPGGDEIAYVEFRVPGRVGYDDVFVFDLSTQEVTRLTDTSQYTVFSAEELNGITLDNPAWSLGGNYLAFVWRTQGKDYIVVASADGSQLTRIAGPGQYDLLIWGQ